MNALVNPTICQWDTATFLFFSENIWGNFIYYSHLFPSLSGLLIAIFVFSHNPHSRAARALLFTVVMFTIWSLLDLILWASESSDLIMFVWSSLIYFELLVFVGCLYFVYAFITNSYPKLWAECLIFVLFIPLFLFGHTALNLTGFDFTNCWREAFEGHLWQYYIYNLELLFSMWIVIFAGVQYWKQKNVKKRQEIILVATGVALFLLSFALGNIAGSLETDWEIGQIGLFGMPVFVAFLTYLMVRYHAFKAKMLATEALVVGLGVLVLSLLFVQKIENVQVIALVTLLLLSALGFLLIRSVKREVRQREEIEKLAEKLEKANHRLKILDQMKSEFVSIASHQLRSPLTAIRGYASMLLEGSFGKLTKPAQDAVERIADSSRYMALSIEDYLNVSRIQAGRMKYEFDDFNFKEMADHITEDVRSAAMKKGLVLMFKSSTTSSRCIVHADPGKTQQIIHNLLDNAMKYTPKGKITLTLRDDTKKKRIYLDVTDTGVGMDKDTLEDVFEKFVRAKNANQVNVTGTGLGLYVARQMAEGMGGTITPHSEGEGKGSTFTLELPLAM